KEYVARTMGYEPGAVTYVTPEWNGSLFRPIGPNEVVAMGVAERVERLLTEARDWTIYPYCHERGVQQFADRLGLGSEIRPFMKQGGVEVLNDKRIFRSLAGGRGGPS